MDDESKRDIRWWHDALINFNGVLFIPPPFISTVQLNLHTDASSFGFGGVFGSHWFFGEWPKNILEKSINFKELLAVIIAFEIWHPHLRGKQIRFFTDNKVICNLWQTHSVKSPDLLSLIRYL